MLDATLRSHASVQKVEIVNSKSCLEMGKTRGSPCFKYLQDFGSEMVTEEMKELFEENMEAS